MTTLENSYCVPKTEGEWIMLAPYYPQELRHYDSIKEWMHDFTRCGHVNFMKFYPNLGVSANNHGRTEIPVQHFVDLVEDKITPWMLEEVNYVKEDDSNAWFCNDYMGCVIVVGFYSDESITVCLHVNCQVVPLEITRFSQLIEQQNRLKPIDI